MALPCARECVKHALETIAIIHSHQDWSQKRVVESLPSWWFEVFFIYTAATVLIPARVYSYIRGDIPQSELLQGWQQSLEVLHHLSSVSPSAVSCIATLQVLDDELVYQGGDTQVAPSGNLSITKQMTQSASQGPSATTGLTQDTAPTSGMGEVSSLHDPDSLDSLLQMQDFTWLDTLPVYMLSGDYAEMQDFWQDLL